MDHFMGISRHLLSNISCQNVSYFTTVLVPGLLGFCLGVQSYSHNNEGNFPSIIVTLHLLPTFDMILSLLSTSGGVSRGKGMTGGEMAPSLLISPRRRLLIIVAGDVERNPGPETYYGE